MSSAFTQLMTERHDIHLSATTILDSLYSSVAQMALSKTLLASLNIISALVQLLMQRFSTRGRLAGDPGVDGADKFVKSYCVLTGDFVTTVTGQVWERRKMECGSGGHRNRTAHVLA